MEILRAQMATATAAAAEARRIEEAERAALEWLARRADRGEADLEQEGLLTRHLGEMGRFPLDVVRFLTGCGNRETFDAWVLRENRRLLASPDPAARIRALDWLAVRGEAPAEFDPFATRSERRDQLRADEEGRRAASQGADATPNTVPAAAGKEPR